MKIVAAARFVLSRTFKAAKGLFLIYILLQVINGFITIGTIFFYGLIIDLAMGRRTFFGLDIFQIILIRLVYEVVWNFIDKFKEYIWNLIDIKQAIYNNQDFVRKLATLDLPTYEDPAKNDMIWRTFNRFQMQFKWYAQYLVDFLQRSIMFLLILVIFAFGSPLIAIIVLIAHLVPIIVRARFGEYSFTIFRADSDTKKKFEYLAGIICGRDNLPEIKLFHAFEFLRHKLISLYRQFTEKQLKLFKKTWITLSFVEILPTLSIFIFLIFTAKQLTDNKISAGIFVLLYINVFWFSGNLTQLMTTVGQLVSDAPFIGEAVSFYELKSVIVFPKLHQDKKLLLIKKLQNPVIDFHNISFTYPNSEKPVLKNLSFSIPYGQNVAIIGENGAGKTTLVKLLMRMYDPTVGSISINGIDLKEIPEDVLFLLYSTLFQSYGKFYMSIRDNLEMANGSNNDEDFIKALKLSNAWNYVKNYPKTLDTQLGPHYKDGVDLSGGQWQQLAIARAYIKKAPILILDEPTSAIDAKAEMEIFDRLIKETKENTVIFISHRFSTIKDAQRIIVLDKGQIVEDGNHEQLIKNHDKYATLYQIQAERYQRI